jgi:hypothetical protein
MAAGICLINIVMAARHLPESNPLHEAKARPPRTPTGQAVRHVLQRASQPSSRLIWIYASPSARSRAKERCWACS